MSADPKPGEWRVERCWCRRTFVLHWQVWDGRAGYIKNPRGRVKRFRSEESANKALAALTTTPEAK